MSGAAARPLFVVFEGLDGTGKTTCARALAERIGARYMSTPCPQVRQLRQAMLDRFDDSQEAAQLFYLATVFDASAKVGRLLEAGVSVVMDRYFLSTQVYAAFRGSRLELDAAASVLVHPDLTVCLHAPLETRILRLHGRGCAPADAETLSPEADARLREGYRLKSSLPVAGRWFDCSNLACVSSIVDTVIGELGTIPGRGEVA